MAISIIELFLKTIKNNWYYYFVKIIEMSIKERKRIYQRFFNITYAIGKVHVTKEL